MTAGVLLFGKVEVAFLPVWTDLNQDTIELNHLYDFYNVIDFKIELQSLEVPFIECLFGLFFWRSDDDN